MNDADRKAFEEFVQNTGNIGDGAREAWKACCEWRDSQMVEPVGWICDFEDGSDPHFTKKPFIATQWIEDGYPVQPVYTAPHTTQINQQLVNFIQEWLHIQGSDNNYMTEKAKAALTATQMRGDA